jgi:hypothetical protein
MERAPPAAVLPLFLASVHLAQGGEEGSISALQLYIVASVLLLVDVAHGRKVAWLLSSPVILLALVGLGFQLIAPHVLARKGRRRGPRQQQRAHNEQVEAAGGDELVKQADVACNQDGGEEGVEAAIQHRGALVNVVDPEERGGAGHERGAHVFRGRSCPKPVPVQQRAVKVERVQRRDKKDLIDGAR